MSRLYVTGDGAWGVIDEDRFAVVNCDLFTIDDWRRLDEAGDGDKLSVAVTTSIALQEGAVPFWDDIPYLLDQANDRLTELSFAEDLASVKDAEDKLRRIVSDIRVGLGLL